MRWNLKEAGRKFPARRTEITYKAVHAGRACKTKRSPILHGAWNVNVAGVWDESGCAYPRRSRRLNTSIELRRVTKAHGDMSVGDEKSAEVIVPLRGRTESWQASATAGCRKSSIGKSTQRRHHGGCRAASSAERKGRVGALIDKRTTEDSYTNTTRGALPGNRRVPNGTHGGVRGR